MAQTSLPAERPSREIETAPDHVFGMFHGLSIPAHGGVLQREPLSFLNEALHAYGSLPHDNRIVAVDRFEPCAVGSTGEKFFLSVTYAKADAALPTELFVKFSRNFDDPFHDRRRFELESEIRFYELARQDTFPIRVPRSVFGDFDPETGTGLLIVEQIAFGAGAIEPLYAKCMDHELARPVDHYRAILSAIARLAGAQRAGLLGDEAETLFPFDRGQAIEEDPILATEGELLAMVDEFAGLVRDSPAIFPAHLRGEGVVARLRACVVAVVRYERELKTFLTSRDDLIALTHFNPNIDNAWFWQNADGTLECGLFDWQRARQMNVAYALWGGLCAASLSLWDEDLDELLARFAERYREAGGPHVDPQELRFHLHLYSAFMGVTGLLGAARLVRQRVPDVARASGPTDPMILANEGARCFLHVFTAFLNFLEKDDFSHRFPAICAQFPPVSAL